jgi:hypothetical protein
MKHDSGPDAVDIGDAQKKMRSKALVRPRRRNFLEKI